MSRGSSSHRSEAEGRASGADPRPQSGASAAGLIVSNAELNRIRGAIGRHPWYRAALDTFEARVDELIARAPEIPVAKGRAFFESCVVCSTRLAFDPYEPHRHACPKCGHTHDGEAFDLAWVRQFQEWLGKRLVEAGILYALAVDGAGVAATGRPARGVQSSGGSVSSLSVSDATASGARERYARVVRDGLAHFVRRYRDYPLANNLLGPTRLFQSTYLEAFWLVDVVAAYDLTRSAGVYSEVDHSGIRDLFYESCGVVRSYDEGVSNRQAFNNAGMGAVGLLYEDAELVEHVLAGPHGFRFHMRESLLEDGIWYEGETYHFATLDHTLDLAEMARHRGIDLYHGASGFGSLRSMFDGPLKVMLPDLTFPSRKDSWFGRGIDYHRDVYELGFARYGDPRYGGLLAHAYAHGGDRSALSWRTFLHLEPELPAVAEDAGSGSSRSSHDSAPNAPRTASHVANGHGVLSLVDLRPTACEPMPGTGIAVLRRDAGGVYAGLEYGHYGGGHGHPDRLHLTLFADGVHWLADPGTGWYHVPELSWYRSTLAHATVTVDGRPQNPREGRLTAFGDAGGFQASQAYVDDVAPGVDMRRTLLLGDGFLIDVFDVTGEPGGQHTFDWAIHTQADLSFDAGVENGHLDQPATKPCPGHAGLTLGERDGYEYLLNVAPLPGAELAATAAFAGKELRILQPGATQGFGATRELDVTQRFHASSPGIPLQEPAKLDTIVVRQRGDRARFATLWAWGEARRDVNLLRDADGLLLFEVGDRAYRVRVDEAPGIAVGVARRGEVDTLAWFGRSDARFGSTDLRASDDAAHAAEKAHALAAVTLHADQALDAAALVRDGDGWRAELPEAFGRIAVSGLPATGLDVPEGVELRIDAGNGLVQLQQPPGRILSLAIEGAKGSLAGEAQELFAGCENEILIEVAAYGLEQVEPTIELPRGWRLSGATRMPAAHDDGRYERDAALTWWQQSVSLPATPQRTEGELVVKLVESRLSVPYRVIAPIATAWRVTSEDGSPRAVLEVRDVRGEGGPVRLDVQCPWLPDDALPRQIVLPPHGRASVTLPLPLTPPGIEHAEDASDDADAGGRIGNNVDGDARDDVGNHARELAGDGAWELPGLTGYGAGFLMTARLSVGNFTGITRARLPVVWALPAGATSASAAHRLRLDRAAQAMWADRRWRDPADASADARLHWSPAGLHLACDVTDDVFVADANADDLYENDSVQVYFDFRPEPQRDRIFSRGVAAYVLAPTEDRDAVRIAPIAGNREISNRGARADWFTIEGVTGSSHRTAGGYRIDAFFPFSSLGVGPVSPGAVIGFDLALSDNDGTWYRNTQLLWSGSRGRRCYIRGSYHDPREYGWLVIGKAP